MIKCEICVSKDEIEIGTNLIQPIAGLEHSLFFRVNNDIDFDYLEEAIKYCLENWNVNI